MAITIKHRVSLDLSLDSVQATVPLRKGDGPVHEVIFTVRNGSEVVELPEGTLAAICIYNGADGGAGVVDMCTVDHVNHTISYIPRIAALSVAGNVSCDLRVIGSDGGSLGSPKFIFFIDESMADVTGEEINKALQANAAWGVIQSTAANALAIEVAKDEAEESAAAAKAAYVLVKASEEATEREKGSAENYAREAKLWANGGSEGDEPGAHNNAKYYASLLKDYPHADQLRVVSDELDVLNGGGTVGLVYELKDESFPGYYKVTGYVNMHEADVVIPDTYRGLAVREITAEAFRGLSISSLVVGKNVEMIGEKAFSDGDIKIYVPWTKAEAPAGEPWGATGGVWTEGSRIYLLYGIKVSLFDDESHATITGVERDISANISLTGRGCTATVQRPAPSNKWYELELDDGEYEGYYTEKDYYYYYDYVNKLEHPFSPFRGGDVVYLRYTVDSKEYTEMCVVDAQEVKIHTYPIEDEWGAYLGRVPQSFYQFSFTLPEGATNIQACARVFTSIQIIVPITHVGEGAFANLSKLRSVKPPDSVTTIGEGAFSYCRGLEEIHIPSGVTSIGNRAFERCTGVKRIRYDAVSCNDLPIDNGIFTQVGMQYGVFNDIEVTVGEGVTRIPANLFAPSSWTPSNTQGIAKVSFAPGSECKSIGSNAFRYCAYLKEVELPYGISEIGEGAFYGCERIESISIPASVTKLSTNLFNSCYRLTDVELSNTITRIGSNAFRNCLRLGRIVMPDSVTEVGSNVFMGCSKLYDAKLSYNLESIGAYMFAECVGLENFSVHDHVRDIGAHAFEDCRSLRTISIGKGVVSMDSYVLAYCESLENIYFNAIRANDFIPGNGTFAYVGERRLSGGGSEVKTPVTVTIGKDVTHIPARLIYPMEGENWHTFAINRIVFEEGCQCATVGERAFQHNRELSEVVLANGLGVIGNNMFQGCEKIESISIPGSCTSVGDNAFNGCIRLGTIILEDGVKTIGGQAFYNCNKDGIVYLTPSIEKISSSAFSRFKGTLNVAWSEGEVSGAPWGSYATINYNNYTPEV